MTTTTQNIAQPVVEAREVPATIQSASDPGVLAQVSTARQYPRAISSFLNRCKEMATLTEEVAKSCIYALPRKEDGESKIIEGPSARLAEIVASAWGNLRIQGAVVGHDDQFVTARGEAWDVETNVAIGFEVRRRIRTSEKTLRNGTVIPARIYSDDMIAVTGNAAASIALRNAVFKAVPSAFWKPIFNACRQVVAGDVKTFHTRRDDALKTFNVMGVPNERIFALLEVPAAVDITMDHMVQLAGVLNAINEKEITLEDAFPAGTQPIKPAQRLSQQAQPQAGAQEAAGAAAASGAPAAGAAAESAPAATTGAQAPPADTQPKPASVGVIVEVKDRTQGAGTPQVRVACIIVLDTGFKAAAIGQTFKDVAERRMAAKVPVELLTKPASNPQFPPVVEAIETA
jgi:hypothetical protein